MSAPAIVWLAAGVFTVLVLLALLVGLIKQLKRVVGALAEFQKAIEPLAQEAQAEAERAREHAEAQRLERERQRDERATARRRRR